MIDLMKPVRHRATKKPVEATVVLVKAAVETAIQVSGMTKYPTTFTNEEFERNYENVPEPREWRIHFFDDGTNVLLDGAAPSCPGCVRVREVLE